MLMDEKGIFQQIKTYVLEKYPNAIIFAFGSRTTGKSRQGKWDFDLKLICNEVINISQLNSLSKHINDKFANIKDENNKNVLIHIFLSDTSLVKNGTRL